MIDLKLLRERPTDVIETYRLRLFDEAAAATAGELLDLDTRRRQIVATADELKAKRNTQSAAVGREKDPDKRAQMIAEMDDFKGRISQADQALSALDADIE